MRLGLMLTSRCNARCSHCSTSCGPHRTEALPRDKIFALMDEAAALAGNEPLDFLLSGGEPFLDFAGLLEIVEHGKRLAAGVSCVTNGSWATSIDKTRDRLRAVKHAGLSALAVSTSRFHQQFVKRRRVEDVLRAAREIGLRCTLKYARTRSDPEDPASIRAGALAAGAHEVEDFGVLPYLSDGAFLPDEEYVRSPGLPQGRCPAPLVTIRQDGEAFTCSSPGALTSLLRLGNADHRTLGQIRDRHFHGGAQQLLRDHGPIHFARELQARGEGARLRASYAGVCDLCAHIASDPEMAAVAAEVSETFERRQLEGILESVGRSDPARPAP